MRNQRADSIEDGIDRAVAGCLMRLLRALDIECQRRRLRTAGPSHHGQRDELDPLVSAGELVIDKRHQILVVDSLFAVGEILEAG